MANLIESYKNRLAISESVHQRSHSGARMSAGKKLMIASVLNNTSRFMNEAFNNSAATQRSALGDFKKFCLNVSTVALPNLILPELMLTQPMTSITGYVTYLRFTAGVNKGGVVEGRTFASPYRLGEMDANRIDYTNARVTEVVKDGKLMWTPVAKVVKARKADGTDYTPEELDAITVAEDGTITGVTNGDTVAYIYNNVIIPQTAAPNSIPTLKAAMNGVALRAHNRRIAVYYSQIAAFQAKTDYGYDLGEQLATQAQGELAYEIDTEGVMMLVNGAEMEDDKITGLGFDSYDLAVKNGTSLYISRSQYYEQFSEIFARAKKIIYTRTQKFAPNYMICGANIATILPYLKGWTAAPATTINGPYMAGTVEGMKVFVSPSMKENEFVFGVNGSDLQTAAAVYAPYMAIVPTQLLGFADGGMSQGFSTMYDMKLLSTYNVEGEGENKVRKDVAENNDDVDTPEVGQYSWLLVKGQMFVA